MPALCTAIISQYAKRANETGNVYAADVEDLKVRLDEIWGKADGILRKLAEIE